MNLLDLMVKIGIQDDASSKVSGIASGIGGKIATAAKVGAAGVAAIGTAAVAVTSTVAGLANATAEYGDTVDKASQKMGISSKAYQEWDAVLQHSGSSMDAMTPAFKKLSTQAQSGSAKTSEAFKKIGLSMEDVKSMSTEDLWAKTIEGLQGMEEGTERTAVASQLLGRGATELGALFNTSAEDTQAMIDKVNELGGVMSEDAVKDSAKFKDTLQDMQTAFTGIKNRIGAEFMPFITKAMDGLTKIASGDIKGGIAELSESFGDIGTKMSELATNVMPVLQEGLNAFIENLPTLLEEGLPQLIDGAADLFLGLVEGLAKATPSILSALASVLIHIVTKIPEYIPRIMVAAVTLIGGMVSGIGSAAGKVATAVGQVAQRGVDAVKKFVSDAMSAGRNIVQGLADGVRNAASTVVSAISGVVSDGIAAAKRLLGIKSPSRVFRAIGDFTMQGLEGGILSGSKRVQRAMGKVAKGMINTPLRTAYSASGGVISAAAAGGINVNLYYSDNESANKLVNDFVRGVGMAARRGA